jgi:hypothetical protein
MTGTQWNNYNAIVQGYITDTKQYIGGGFLTWQVAAQNIGGMSPWSDPNEFYLSTSILHHDNKSDLHSFSIQNSTVLYTLASPSPVELSLFSLSGRRIPLFSRFQSPGSYSFSLKNRNVSPGMYFLHFKAGTMEKRMKVVWSGG